MSDKTNLFDLSIPALEQWVLDRGQPRYRVRQILSWVHQRRVRDWDKMTDVSKVFRQVLASSAELTLPEFAHEKASRDGTRKWLCRLEDGNIIETVYIPERGRATLCVSSQVGCGLNCSFCSTGKEGFNRDLKLSEIIGQVWLANNRLAELGLPPVTNVVMMGMGEPLLNFDAVVAATELMLSDWAYGLSKYRVTLSTSGLIPKMEQLKACSDVALAVSLHAPNDDLRNELVPLNKKYPLADLMAVCRDYFAGTKRSVTFEYVMLAGVNDSMTHAKQLIRLLEGVPAKVNLIPFNSFPGTQYQCSAPAVVQAFSDRLRGAGVVSTIRKTRGDDVDGACGQLAGQFKDRTGRKRRWQVTGKLVPKSTSVTD